MLKYYTAYRIFMLIPISLFLPGYLFKSFYFKYKASD